MKNQTELPSCINRKTVKEIVDNKNTTNEVRLTCYLQLIIEELINIHGTQSYYDSKDGGKLSAILLMIDNFIGLFHSTLLTSLILPLIAIGVYFVIKKIKK